MHPVAETIPMRVVLRDRSGHIDPLPCVKRQLAIVEVRTHRRE
jgi:hypothetical protein